MGGTTGTQLVLHLSRFRRELLPALPSGWRSASVVWAEIGGWELPAHVEVTGGDGVRRVSLPRSVNDSARGIRDAFGALGDRGAGRPISITLLISTDREVVDVRTNWDERILFDERGDDGTELPAERVLPRPEHWSRELAEHPRSDANVPFWWRALLIEAQRSIAAAPPAAPLQEQGQPWQGQPWQGQPWQGQAWQGQPWQGQPWQGHPAQGQFAHGQPWQGQPWQAHPLQGQGDAQSNPTTGQLPAGQSWGQQQWGPVPPGASPDHAQGQWAPQGPWGHQPHGQAAWNGQVGPDGRSGPAQQYPGYPGWGGPTPDQRGPTGQGQWMQPPWGGPPQWVPAPTELPSGAPGAQPGHGDPTPIARAEPLPQGGPYGVPSGALQSVAPTDAASSSPQAGPSTFDPADTARPSEPWQAVTEAVPSPDSSSSSGSSDGSDGTSGSISASASASASAEAEGRMPLDAPTASAAPTIDASGPPDGTGTSAAAPIPSTPVPVRSSTHPVGGSRTDRSRTTDATQPRSRAEARRQAAAPQHFTPSMPATPRIELSRYAQAAFAQTGAISTLPAAAARSPEPVSPSTGTDAPERSTPELERANPTVVDATRAPVAAPTASPDANSVPVEVDPVVTGGRVTAEARASVVELSTHRADAATPVRALRAVETPDRQEPSPTGHLELGAVGIWPVPWKKKRTDDSRAAADRTGGDS